MKAYLPTLPLCSDIRGDYRAYRVTGKNRTEAIEAIKEGYHNELDDPDDRPRVYLGLALALAQKKELTREIAAEADRAIQELLETDAASSATLTRIRTELLQGDYLGPEASYKKRTPYTPDWKVGDTFAHRLSHPEAKKRGLSDWFVIFRKAGEYFDIYGRPHQLVYVTLCPPDRLPRSAQELEALGYLRMLSRDHGWEYIAQIRFGSKHEEEFCELERIGCFPEFRVPDDCVQTDPLVAMPLFGQLSRSDCLPSFEKEVSLRYHWNGIADSSREA